MSFNIRERVTPYCSTKHFSLNDLIDLQFRMCRGILFQILGPEY